MIFFLKKRREGGEANPNPKLVPSLGEGVTASPPSPPSPNPYPLHPFQTGVGGSMQFVRVASSCLVLQALCSSSPPEPTLEAFCVTLVPLFISLNTELLRLSVCTYHLLCVHAPHHAPLHSKHVWRHWVMGFVKWTVFLARQSPFNLRTSNLVETF